MSGPRFSIIPGRAVTDPQLEPRDLQVLCLLGRHISRGGWCVRSQVKMAREISCGRATLQRSLERLIDAGYVETRRRDVEPDDSNPGQPSASYAYRVSLDRDDYALDSVASSHAEDASPEGDSDDGGCPPAGTPGARPDGHPGAHPERAPRAHTYAGTITSPVNAPTLNVRETRARAGEDLARFLATLETRWPTAAVDDRQKTAYEAAAVPPEERGDAIAGIAPFLEKLRANKRTSVPALWKYLSDRKWKLLGNVPETPAGSAYYERGSVEARAVAMLYAIAGKADFLKFMRGPNDTLSYRGRMTMQIRALAQAPADRDRWCMLSVAQAAAWDRLLDDHVTVQVRTHLRGGSVAPWPWPPSVEGVIYEPEPEPEPVDEGAPEPEPDAPELAPQEAWQEPDETFSQDDDSDGEAA